MTPQQKLTNAYNEFIADYVERHGECKATRDEAHKAAEWIESMAKEVASLCQKYSSDAEIAGDAADDLASGFIDENNDIDGKDEAKFLAACAIAAALEVV